jgi:uncharacterized membrane protein
MIGFWIFFSIYSLISLYFTKVVIKSPIDKKKKWINVILVWIVPVIWGLLIKTMFKPIKEKDKRIDRSNYYESGIGEIV